MTGRCRVAASVAAVGLALLVAQSGCTRSQTGHAPSPAKAPAGEQRGEAPAEARPVAPPPTLTTRPASRVPSIPAPPPAVEGGIPAPIIEPPPQPPMQEPPPEVPDLEAPEYVTVLERYDPGAPAQVIGGTETGSRIVLETHNVRRLRIDRARAGTYLDRSVALRLDGQGIKWLANSETTEFERSPNGIWSPVPPPKPVRSLRR